MTHEKSNKSDFNKLMDKDKTPDVNQNYIILGFFEFDFFPDVFTKELGLEPFEKGLKGEKYFVGSKKQHQKVHEYNMWTHQVKSYSNDHIDDLIAKYIDEIIKPRIDLIKSLTKSCNVQLRIVQYYYNGYNPTIYIKREYSKILAEINSSIDIDLYCFGD